MTESENHQEDLDIEQVAVIGMAARFPGAGNIHQFWHNLKNGIESITRFSDEELLARGVDTKSLSHPDYVKAGTVLENIDLFDAEFFGYTSQQAKIMDPQQRIFLEICWEALEDGGCIPGTYTGRIGVFAGAGANDYRKRIAGDFHPPGSSIESFQSMISNDPDFLTTRVAYCLDLRGPCYTLQTACSTSLVAIHTACQHLLMYQCDAALAGGVSIRLPQGLGYLYQEGMIWSPDGHCRAFDAEAKGIVLGRGGGVVLLKRLSDAIAENDHIYAVIKASAINNDGAGKIGYTAPSVEGQVEVIATAQELAEVPPETISYVEAHGTGTPLGDPIEVEALTKAFRKGTQARNFCAIGSVKTNIGHLDAAAGVASFIKTALSLKHKTLVPSLHFKKPNPDINFTDSPFFVSTQLTKWNNVNGPLRAGVSSLGIGGTNAHTVLEEAPERKSLHPKPRWHILPMSTKYTKGVAKAALRLSQYLQENPDLDLADVAYTMQHGRKHFDHRFACACQSLEQAVEILSGPISISRISEGPRQNNEVVFLFSGQGSQYPAMCGQLYATQTTFREQVDHCCTILRPVLDLDLRELLFPQSQKMSNAEVRIHQTDITQPALFVVEYSLAKLLHEWNVVPAAMAGHSIGEYVAACLSGVFSLEEALKLVAVRGELMQQIAGGAMLAVPLSEKDLEAMLPAELSIAVINSPKMTVVSGKEKTIRLFKEQLERESNLESHVLQTSHAFHSPMMEPILADFTKTVASVKRNTPRIPFVSNVTGTWITDEEAVSPKYWANHLRQPVRFFSCIDSLFSSSFSTFVEIGPGQVLTNLAQKHPQSSHSLILPTTPRHVHPKNEQEVLLKTLAALWTNGLPIKWPGTEELSYGKKIPLPTYPFQPTSYWLKPGRHPLATKSNVLPNPRQMPIEAQEEVDSVTNFCGPRNDQELQIATLYGDILGIKKVDIRDNFFDIGGDSLLAVQFVANLRQLSGRQISLANIFENPSVESLADFLKQGKDRIVSAILPLNEQKSENLIYFVVGIHIYQELAQHLNDVASCYGVYLPVEETLFKSNRDYSKWSVENLAEAYCEIIVKHSGGRPVSIAGVSFGGFVAYEVARKLHQAGQMTPLLVMMDSLHPSGVSRDYIKWTIGQIKSLFAHGVEPFAKKAQTKLSGRLKKIKKARRLVSGVNNSVVDQREVVYDGAVERFGKNEHKTKYSRKTLLLRALDVKRTPGDKLDRYYGWKQHITGEFVVDSVPGDHLGILKAPNVRKTAAIIKNMLQGAVHQDE